MQFAPGITESRKHSGTRLIVLVPVTTIAATVLGVWLVILSLRVISQRRTASVSLGDGGDENLSRRIRAQANLSEYAPTGLILLLLAELQGTQLWWLVICASLLVLG
ncbi:MAG: MAPEG family protein, partial [Pseudomonadota bacterium]